MRKQKADKGGHRHKLCRKAGKSNQPAKQESFTKLSAFQSGQFQHCSVRQCEDADC